MRKLSVCQLTFDPSQSFQRDVDEIARNGIEGITVVGAKADAIGLGKAKRLISDAGLKVAGYVSGGWFTVPGEFDARVEEAKRTLDAAARMEADFLLLITGPLGEMTQDEARQRFLDGVRAIAPAAKAHNVRLAVEPLHPILPMSMVHTLRDAIDLASEVEGLGIVLDTWHLWWNWHVVEDIPESIDRVYCVQINDYALPDGDTRLSGGGPRLPLGEGIIPLRRILHAVDKAGYDGYYDIEVIGRFSEERRKTLVADCKRYFDALWQ